MKKLTNYLLVLSSILFSTAAFGVDNPSEATHQSDATTSLPSGQKSSLRFRYVDGERLVFIETDPPLSDDAIEFSGDYTVETLVFPEQFERYSTLMVKLEPGSTYDQWKTNSIHAPVQFGIQLDPEGRVVFRHSSGTPESAVSLTSDKIIASGVWTHIAVVYRVGTMELYIDGQIAGSLENVDPPSTQAAQPFLLGAHFNGSLAQVRVWDRALSVEEIGINIGKYVAIEPDLLAYWPLDDQSNLSSRNLSSNGFPLQWEMLFSHFRASPRPVSPVDLARGSITESIVYDPEKEALYGFPIDFNNDGATDYVRAGYVDPELFTNSPPYWLAPAPIPMTAWQNDGNGNFVDVSAEVFTSDIQVITNSGWIVADFNGDGRDDAFIVDFGADPLPEPCPNDWCFPGARGHLLIQTPEGTLDDRSATNLPDVHAIVHSAAAADIDGDGDIDLFMGVSGSDGPPQTCMTADPIPDGAPCSGFYINDGTGHFNQDLTRLPEVFTRGIKFSLASALVDIDGDEDVDLLIGLNLLVNDGEGMFTELGELPPVTDLTGGPVRLAHADFNSDGMVDIFSWFETELMSVDDIGNEIGRLRLFLGTGNGAFRDASDQIPLSEHEVGTERHSLALADFDGDGSIDISYFSKEGGRLLFNDGNGVFTLSSAMADLHFSFAQFITTADVNSDGRPDWISDRGAGFLVSMNQFPLVECTDDPLNILRSENCGFDSGIDRWSVEWGVNATHNINEGIPSPGSYQIESSVDSDGDRVITIRSPCVRIDPSSTYQLKGQFKLTDPLNTVNCGVAAAGYSDGNCSSPRTGVTDDNEFRVSGSGWTSVSNTYVSQPDSSSMELWAYCWEDGADPAFTMLMDNFILEGPPYWLANDFNGDKRTDLPWRNQATGQNRLWLMNGPVREVAGSIPAIASDWTVAGTGDFDMDGNVDIYWRNNVSGINRIWFMNGLTRTGFAPTLRMIDTDWQVGAICDLNNDGKADIVWRHSTLPQTRAWIMNGATQIDRGGLPQARHPWFIAGCGDFDGDGYDDILWRNATTGQNRIWLMKGVTRMASGSINIANINFRVGGVGDFTNDRKADILWHDDATGRSLLWEMDGLTRLSGTALKLQSPAFTGAAIGDWGGDGKLDIFWRNLVNGKNQIWNMNGAIRMSTDAVVAMPPDFSAVP